MTDAQLHDLVDRLIEALDYYEEPSPVTKSLDQALVSVLTTFCLREVVVAKLDVYPSHYGGRA